jgi:hypothetical protein
MGRFILFTFAIFITTTSFALACSCLKPDDKESAKHFNEADIVIYARIINPSKGFTQAGPLLNVETLHVIKGQDVPKTMNINYNNNAAACGHVFEKGEEAILAIYDTRQISSSQTRGYGFRLMSLCQQYQVRHHVKQQKMLKTSKYKHLQSYKETYLEK